MRKVIFWCHLVAGVFAGVVVLIMSVTGVLLTYEKQMLAQADARTYKIAPTSPVTRLPIATLVARAREAKPAAVPTNITFRPAPTAAAAVAFGREGSVFVNPYTGEVLGEGAKGMRDFFRVVTDWHRWLGAGGERRSIARGVTGACNLAFLFLVTSGIYLWMPRKWTRKQVRSVAWFKRGLSGKARDFNWHNVIGLWTVVPLFVVVLAAVPISYTWASNLVYSIVGEEPPQPRGPQTPAPGGPPQQRGAVDRGAPTVSLDGLDQLLARAEQQMPDWQSISMQLPAAAGAPVSFTIDAGSGGQPHKRAQLTLDGKSGEVVRWEPFSSFSRGRQLRSFLRFAHTGEVAGLVGQTVAGLASLGAAVLVWTGLALTWRRFRAWRVRGTVASPAASWEARREVKNNEHQEVMN
ncbi:MAG TPA: PepSY-associated TM helix domain-containing protein [Pyrinomonadaceae bacterium]|nr:PepSY-associated TM helix domain-containing protein [Pyrinomonadaceae bacterium]